MARTGTQVPPSLSHEKAGHLSCPNRAFVPDNSPNMDVNSLIQDKNDTKYDLPLQIISKKSNYMEALQTFPTLQAWYDQINSNLGLYL